MTDHEIKTKETIELLLRNVMDYAWEGLRQVRIKFPIPTNEGKIVKVGIFNHEAMESIFQFIKQGINRGCIDAGEEPIFNRINDMPDPEAEFDKQIFKIKADLADRLKDMNDPKEIMMITSSMSKLGDNKKRVSIRKLDLKLAVALARNLDPAITEDRVIEILEFERERLS